MQCSSRSTTPRRRSFDLANPPYREQHDSPPSGGRGQLPRYSSDAFFTRFMFLLRVDTVRTLPKDRPEAAKGTMCTERVNPPNNKTAPKANTGGPGRDE